jgi:magnesium transporter
MNLKNFIEETDLGFLGTSAMSFVFAALVCSYGLVKLRKVQRVSMWGEQGRKNRGSWRETDPLPRLNDRRNLARFDRMKRLKETKENAAGKVQEITGND